MFTLLYNSKEVEPEMHLLIQSHVLDLVITRDLPIMQALEAFP